MSNTNKSLNDLRDESYQISKEHGFHEEEKSIGDYIALMHSELSEALEDHRNGHLPNEFWYEEKGGNSKPCGIPSEMSDVIIRVLDFCGAHGIDIEKSIIEKMAYNKTRPYKHGKKVI